MTTTTKTECENDDQYPYLVLDTFSSRLKSEPVAGYFRTRHSAEENAKLRNRQRNDAYAMTRYIVYGAVAEETRPCHY